MADLQQYELSQEELERIFHTEVKRFLFEGHPTDERPIALLTGGQPAAGKSQAMAAARQRNADRHIIQLSTDDLRQFHPKFRWIMENDPVSMVSATQQAAAAWNRMAADYAIEHGHSVSIEGTFRAPQAVLDDAQRYSEAGFEVEVIALAVRGEQSRLDALGRFLSPGTGEPSRWVYPEWHDLSYETIPVTAAAAEASPHVNRVTVTNRSGADLFVNTRPRGGELTSPPGAAQAVLDERARPMPTADADRWLSRQRDVHLEFVSTGQMTELAKQSLDITLKDAATIAPMSSVSRDEASQVAHQTTQYGLPLVTNWALEGAQAQRPLFLVPDDKIQARLNRLQEQGEFSPNRTTQPAGLGASLSAEMNRRANLAPAQHTAEGAIRKSAQEFCDRDRPRASTGTGVTSGASSSLPRSANRQAPPKGITM